jgi:hypothetical protein
MSREKNIYPNVTNFFDCQFNVSGGGGGKGSKRLTQQDFKVFPLHGASLLSSLPRRQ